MNTRFTSGSKALALLDGYLSSLEQIRSLKERVQLEARGCTATQRRSRKLEKLSNRRLGSKSTGRKGSPVEDELAVTQQINFMNMEMICREAMLVCPTRETVVGGNRPFYMFEEACMFVRSYLEVCRDNFEQFLVSTNSSSLLSPLRIMANWDVALFPKYCKYCTAYLHAYLLRDVDPSNLPPLPDRYPSGLKAAIPFKGCALRFIINRLSGRVSRKTFAFTWAIVQGVKRGTATVSSLFVVDTMLSHKKALSVEPPFNEAALDDFDDHLERMSSSMVTTRAYLREVSTSASYEAKKSEGGARETIRSQLTSNEELLSMKYDPTLGVQSAYTNVIVPEVGHLLDEWFPTSTFDPQATVAPVLEPLKCRLITKGNSREYWLARGFQKDMWNYLGQFDQFSPTHGPIDLSDFYALLERESRFPNAQLEYWVSGDYSAATDGLNMWFSNETLEFLLRRSEFRNLNSLQQMKYRNLLRSVLGSHHISYPLTKGFLKNLTRDALFGTLSAENKKKAELLLKELTDEKISESLWKSKMDALRVDPTNFFSIATLSGYFGVPDKICELSSFDQKNGQLMGSPLSFPILCLVNAVQYWRSFEEYIGHAVEFSDLPVLINGDDILFRSNPAHYAIWKKYVAEAGFKLSQGKNYLSDRFFCINSQGFIFDKGTRTIQKLTALNVGLLQGKPKLGGGSGKLIRYAGLDSTYNEMVKDAVDKANATRRFLYYNRDSIMKITQNGLYNLFVPRVLGGVGLVLPEGISQYLTLFQKCLVRKLYRYVERGFVGKDDQVNLPVKVSLRHDKRQVYRCPKPERKWVYLPFGPIEEQYQLVEDPVLTLRESLAVAEVLPEKDNESSYKLKTSFYNRSEVNSIKNEFQNHSHGARSICRKVLPMRTAYTVLPFGETDM